MVWYGMVCIYFFFCGGGVKAGNFAPYVTQPFCALWDISPFLSPLIFLAFCSKPKL